MLFPFTELRLKVEELEDSLSAANNAKRRAQVSSYRWATKGEGVFYFSLVASGEWRE